MRALAGRAARKLRHICDDPVASLRRWESRTTARWPLPVGPTAQDSRLLAALLPDTGDPLLLVGPPTALDRAVPDRARSTAGLASWDSTVDVVSRVDRRHSLPAGRWRTVVVTDLGPGTARLVAVAGAVVPDGIVVAVGPRGSVRRAVADAELAARRVLVRGRREAVVAGRP